MGNGGLLEKITEMNTGIRPENNIPPLDYKGVQNKVNSIHKNELGERIGDMFLQNNFGQLRVIPNPTKEGITRLQNSLGLKTTGELDKQTIEILNQRMDAIIRLYTKSLFAYNNQSSALAQSIAGGEPMMHNTPGYQELQSALEGVFWKKVSLGTQTVTQPPVIRGYNSFPGVTPNQRNSSQAQGVGGNVIYSPDGSSVMVRP